MVAVVDAYVPLTEDRPYRPAMDRDEALSIITSGRGTAYDPDMVDSFLDHIGHGQKTSRL